MSLDSFLIDVLRDPVDGGELYYVEQESVLYNPRRRVAYEVKGAIPVLLPDEAREVSDADHALFVAPGAFTITGSKNHS